MAELVFVTVFRNHSCRKKVNKTSEIQEIKRLETGERNAMLKKNIIAFARWSRELSYATLNFYLKFA